MKRYSLFAILLLFLFCACSQKKQGKAFEEPFVVFLVDAPHLDYRSSQTVLRSLAKTPDGYVGHAWLYAQGRREGKPVVFEGGHSGERGIQEPKYFEGVMNYIEYGTPAPSPERESRYEPNPIQYLWASLHDGFLQSGNGGHRPTYAAQLPLSQEQFERLIDFVSPENYDYTRYSLVDNQCVTFVTQAAALLGIALENIVEIPIEHTLRLRKGALPLRRDEDYAFFPLPSPDTLEKSLREAVQEGRMQEALYWYTQKQRLPPWRVVQKIAQRLFSLPQRMQRYSFYSQISPIEKGEG